MLGGDSATIYDVAEAAGVSPSTVSHVVNGTRNVSDAKRRRVEAAIARLGYRPNDAARMLREGRAKLIGVICPDTSNPFFSRIAYHLEMLAFDAGARIVNCNSDYDPEREQAYLEDLIRRRVDGIIIAPVSPSHAIQDRLLATGLPAVVIDRVSDALTLPSVAIDNAAGASLAAHHLHSLGHRRIGCVTAAPGQVESVDVRSKGFADTLAGLGLTLPAQAIRYGEFKVASGLDAAADLLAAHPGLTAIFCTNDAMAVGALRAAAQAGRAVPESLSIMGFDDSLEALLCQPHLTTIAQPVEAMAQAAMQLLRAEPGASHRTRLQARLVVRESTAPPAPASPAVLRRVPPSAPVAARPARILIAGADAAARRQARLLQRLPNAVIAGVHDPATLRANDLAAALGAPRIDTLEAALARGDVDGVIVNGPPQSRAQAILAAARYGVGVLAAVPFAADAAELAQVAAACSGTLLHGALPRGFDPGIVELAAQLRAGRVGPLASLRIVCRDGLAPAGLFEALDLLSLLAGAPDADIAAMGQGRTDPDLLLLMLRFGAPQPAADVAAHVAALAPPPGGIAGSVLATVELSRLAPAGFEHRVEAIGSLGQLTARARPDHGVSFRGHDTPMPAQSFAPRPFAPQPFAPQPFAEGAARQMQAFVHALATGAAGPRLEGHAASLGELVATHRLAFAAAAALASGHPVRSGTPDTIPARTAGRAG